MMLEFAKYLLDRNKKKHNSIVDLRAQEFMKEYEKERELMSLCFIAAMYNRDYKYNRKMYRDFCALPREVQNRVLRIKEIEVYVHSYRNMYKDCIEAINSLAEDYDEKVPRLFGESGAFFEKALKDYGNLSLHNFDRINKEDIEGSLFRCMMEEKPKIHETVEYIRYMNHYSTCSEEECCYLDLIMAKYISICYIYKHRDRLVDYGLDECYYGFVHLNSEKVDACLEDLFLNCLHEIFINLLVTKKNMNL